MQSTTTIACTLRKGIYTLLWKRCCPAELKNYVVSRENWWVRTRGEIYAQKCSWSIYTRIAMHVLASLFDILKNVFSFFSRFFFLNMVLIYSKLIWQPEGEYHQVSVHWIHSLPYIASQPVRQRKSDRHSFLIPLISSSVCYVSRSAIPRENLHCFWMSTRIQQTPAATSWNYTYVGITFFNVSNFIPTYIISSSPPWYPTQSRNLLWHLWNLPPVATYITAAIAAAQEQQHELYTNIDLLVVQYH